MATEIPIPGEDVENYTRDFGQDDRISSWNSNRLPLVYKSNVLPIS
jgi:hypothetical protein